MRLETASEVDVPMRVIALHILDNVDNWQARIQMLSIIYNTKLRALISALLHQPG
jgi:hypothetical protein